MLEEKDITKHCDSRVLRRARNIARATDSIHTRKCLYEPQAVGKFKLRARVASGQDWRQSYDVEIDVDELEHKIRSYDCTCQAALSQMGMCKHVAAAALAFVEHPETYLGYVANRSAVSSEGIVRLLESALGGHPAPALAASESQDEPEDDVGKGGSGCAPKVKKAAKGEFFDMATIDISKMSPEDKITWEALAKKYSDNGENEEPAIHPDVKKALEEVAEMRKSMELEKLEGVAKKYEIIGKKAPELAQKLYDLKQAGEQHYNDYVALLDEQVAMANSGIYKEYGSSRSATDLSATVAEVMKANPNMTREQAIVQAFESNPALDPFTGRVK